MSTIWAARMLRRARDKRMRVGGRERERERQHEWKMKIEPLHFSARFIEYDEVCNCLWLSRCRLRSVICWWFTTHHQHFNVHKMNVLLSFLVSSSASWTSIEMIMEKMRSGAGERARTSKECKALQSQWLMNVVFVRHCPPFVWHLKISYMWHDAKHNEKKLFFFALKLNNSNMCT